MALLAKDSVMSHTSIRLFRHLKHQNLSTGDNIIYSSRIIFFLFLATREAVVPLAKDLIMSGTLIKMFRHLKHQNLSTSDDFVNRTIRVFLFHFL